MCHGTPRDVTHALDSRMVDVGELLGGIQQLRGQERGEGGQQKLHACPPGGGDLMMSTWTKMLKKVQKNHEK